MFSTKQTRFLFHVVTVCVWGPINSHDNRGKGLWLQKQNPHYIYFVQKFEITLHSATKVKGKMFKRIHQTKF